MPALPRRQGCLGSCHLVSVLRLPATDLGHGGYDFPGHAEAAGDVVSRDVVCDQPEERCQRAGLAAGPGTGSYETAWTWLHKLRRAMVRPDRDRLNGWVEVDETLWAGWRKAWQVGKPRERPWL